MTAHMSHPRRGSGDTDPTGALRRPKPTRSSRVRRYGSFAGPRPLPGPGALRGTALDASPGEGRAPFKGPAYEGALDGSSSLGRLRGRDRGRDTGRRCEGAGFHSPGRRRPRRRTRCDGGMSTAEYALGTVSAVAFAGVLYVILTGGTVTEVLTDIVVDALSSGM